MKDKENFRQRSVEARYLLNIRLYNLLDVICKKETVRSKWIFIAITGKQSCILFINPQTFIKISVGYFPHIRQQLFPPPPVIEDTRKLRSLGRGDAEQYYKSI